MSKLRELQHEILVEGVDLQIDAADWARIRELLPSEAAPSHDDLQVLLEMRNEAKSVCREFDAYFFPAFKSHILADGQISNVERFELLRLLYGGDGVDEPKRRFLKELRAGLRQPSPEFDAMYQQAMRD
ncbi:MAG: hypothetical protein K1X57_01045 [Gemmataceae bacterium]|nr:hypothetical protein [Gemmataceae bacterium]